MDTRTGSSIRLRYKRWRWSSGSIIRRLVWRERRECIRRAIRRKWWHRTWWHHSRRGHKRRRDHAGWRWPLRESGRGEAWLTKGTTRLRGELKVEATGRWSSTPLKRLCDLVDNGLCLVVAEGSVVFSDVAQVVPATVMSFSDRCRVVGQPHITIIAVVLWHRGLVQAACCQT